MKISYCINQNRATILNKYKTNITIYERRLELSCVGFLAKEDSKLETEEKLL